MLVLTRKKGQYLYIGEDISIVILDNKEGQTRVGIEAPKSFKILRDNAVNKNKKELSDGKL